MNCNAATNVSVRSWITASLNRDLDVTDGTKINNNNEDDNDNNNNNNNMEEE